MPEIRKGMEKLVNLLIAAGFKFDTSWVLQNVTENNKQTILCGYR